MTCPRGSVRAGRARTRETWAGAVGGNEAISSEPRLLGLLRPAHRPALDSCPGPQPPRVPQRLPAKHSGAGGGGGGGAGRGDHNPSRPPPPPGSLRGSLPPTRGGGGGGCCSRTWRTLAPSRQPGPTCPTLPPGAEVAREGGTLKDYEAPGFISSSVNRYSGAHSQDFRKAQHGQAAQHERVEGVHRALRPMEQVSRQPWPRQSSPTPTASSLLLPRSGKVGLGPWRCGGRGILNSHS